VKRGYEEFTETFEPNCISVLFDPLDGTNCFRQGLPLFSSAIALFVDGKLAVSGIYDPSRHVCYYASQEGKEGWVWSISEGSSVELHKERERIVEGRRGVRAIAFQITRDKKEEKRL
jgi:fructose-1,6-bisphosphatase/inositol monophosphatase family enzyme